MLTDVQILSFRIFRGQAEAEDVGTRVRYCQGSLDIKDELRQYLDHRLGAMAVAGASSLLPRFLSLPHWPILKANRLTDSVYEPQHASMGEENGSTPLWSWPATSGFGSGALPFLVAQWPSGKSQI